MKVITTTKSVDTKTTDTTKPMCTGAHCEFDGKFYVATSPSTRDRDRRPSTRDSKASQCTDAHCEFDGKSNAHITPIMRGGHRLDDHRPTVT